jgi:hypothetical protein
MKPRTVYEKAVQDFTQTARRLARLNQRFRGASFAEFEMLMGLDDEALKRSDCRSRWSSGRSSKCMKPSCSVSRETGITLDWRCCRPPACNGWGPFLHLLHTKAPLQRSPRSVADVQRCHPNVTSGVSILHTVSEPRHRVGEGEANTCVRFHYGHRH